MRKELEAICKSFGITLDDIDQRLDELGEAGLLVTSRKVFTLSSRIYARQIPGLHLTRFYFAMASLLLKNVQNVLEIGTGAAEGTICLAKLFPKATVYTVDIPLEDPDYKEFCQNVPGTPRGKTCEHNLKQADNITCIEKNSFFLPLLLQLPKQFDLIFVDGAHVFPQVGFDLMFAYSHIVDGGFLFIHDYNPKWQKTPNCVSPAVNWVEQRIKEKVFFFPMMTDAENAHLKMVLIIKNRYLKPGRKGNRFELQ
ncbi:hypothetical protein ES703_55896 [subsurface metagenome]